MGGRGGVNAGGGAPQVPSLKPLGGGVEGERQIGGRQTDQWRGGEGGEGGEGARPAPPLPPATSVSAVIPQSGRGAAGASAHF